MNNTDNHIWQELITEGLAKTYGELNYDRICQLPETSCNNTLTAVIGTDTRTEVSTPYEPPYQAIFLLLMKYGDDMYRGTGFLIKDDVVLTAGHNLYEQQTKQYADKVYIIAKTKDKLIIRTHTGFKLSTTYTTENTNDGSADWGLVKIKEPFSDCDILPLQKASDTSAKQFANVTIAGYPAKTQKGDTESLWEASGDITEYLSQTETLKHQISTSVGNSGSPVLIHKDENVFAVGIHVLGASSSNTAKAIDAEILQAVTTM